MSNIYHEFIFDLEKNYTQYLIKVLKYLIDNESELTYKSLLNTPLFKLEELDLNEKEINFIIFLLDNILFIELQTFGKNPASNYDTFPYSKEDLLKFERVTTLGSKYYREIREKR